MDYCDDKICLWKYLPQECKYNYVDETNFVLVTHHYSFKVQECKSIMYKSKVNVQCGVCKFTLKRADNLKRHFENKHPSQQPFQYIAQQTKLCFQAKSVAVEEILHATLPDTEVSK